MKKLLIVSYSFPPSNVPAAQRPYQFYKYLSDESIVLTSNDINARYGASNASFDNNPDIIRTGNFNLQESQNAISYNKNGVKYKLLKEFLIPDKGIKWLGKGLKQGSVILKEYPSITHIYSSSPSVVNHIIALRLGKMFNKIVVCDFRDFYYSYAIEEKQYKFRGPIDKTIEKWIFNNADYLIFISNSMRDFYSEKLNITKDKTRVIYNGFDSSEFKPTIINKRLNNNTLQIFYAGSFYSGERSLKPLLGILDKLIINGHINIKSVNISIAGIIEHKILDDLNKFESFGMIKMLGTISRTEVFKKYAESHLLLLVIGNKINHYVGYPIKLFEYFGAKRPILSFIPSKAEANTVLSQLDYNFTFYNDKEIINEGNITKFYNIFTRHHNGDLDLVYELPTNLRKIFSRKVQSKLLKNIIDNEQ